MATTTIGQNTATNDWAWDGTMKVIYINNNYTIGGSVLGRMINTNCFFARVNAGGSGGARAWRNGSIVLDTTTDSVTLGNTGAGTSGQADASCSWHTSSGDIPTANTENWLFGCNCSSGLYATYTNGSPNTWDQTNGVNAFATAGTIHAYGTYFIVETYVRRSGVWTKSFIYVRRGSGWSLPGTYVRRSGTWIQVGHLANGIAFDPVKTFEIMYQDENGTWLPGMLRFEGPFYIGSPGAREMHLRGEPRSIPYELVAV